MFIDNLILSIQQDPIYVIVAIIVLVLGLLLVSKSLFERIVDGIADYITDETKPTEERVADFTFKISAGLDLAMDKVGKRKGVINFFKTIVNSDGTKRWLVKVMNKYPSVTNTEENKSEEK